MKDIRETQIKNYEISGILWSSGLIFVIVYSIINILI